MQKRGELFGTNRKIMGDHVFMSIEDFMSYL